MDVLAARATPTRERHVYSDRPRRGPRLGTVENWEWTSNSTSWLISSAKYSLRFCAESRGSVSLLKVVVVMWE